MLGAALTLGACQKSEEAKPADPPLQFTASEVTHPLLQPMATTLTFSGPLVAPDTAVVRAKASGTLLALNVHEGDHVRSGQVLGKLDLTDLQARLAERSAQVQSARAQLMQAERVHQSNLELAKQNFISSNAVDTSQASLDSARAMLRAAQAQAETMQVALRDAALVAPIDGIVYQRQVVPGEKVSAEQVLFTIVDLQRLEMAGTVGTHEVAQLQPGMPVRLRIEGVEKPVEAKLARIAPAADPGTRSIGVVVAITNDNERLRAGQFALAEVKLGGEDKRLTVPASAIVSASGQQYVWVIDQGKLMRRTVTTGRQDDLAGRVEILEGLHQDSQVLAARFDNLREGGEAFVQAGPAGTGAPSAALPVTSASASAPNDAN